MKIDEMYCISWLLVLLAGLVGLGAWIGLSIN